MREGRRGGWDAGRQAGWPQLGYHEVVLLLHVGRPQQPAVHAMRCAGCCGTSLSWDLHHNRGWLLPLQQHLLPGVGSGLLLGHLLLHAGVLLLDCLVDTLVQTPATVNQLS
jgi:hypothetical protein